MSEENGLSCDREDGVCFDGEEICADLSGEDGLRG